MLPEDDPGTNLVIEKQLLVPPPLNTALIAIAIKTSVILKERKKKKKQ